MKLLMTAYGKDRTCYAGKKNNKQTGLLHFDTCCMVLQFSYPPTIALTITLIICALVNYSSGMFRDDMEGTADICM